MRNRKRHGFIKSHLVKQLDNVRKGLAAFFVKHLTTKKGSETLRERLEKQRVNLKLCLGEAITMGREFAAFLMSLNKQPVLIRRGVSSLVAIMLVLGVFTVARANGPYAVEIDGQRIAVIKNKALAHQVVNSLIEEQQQIVSSVKTDQKITFKTALFSRGDILNEDEYKRALAKHLTFETVATGISVNGGLKCAVKDKATAEMVLEKLKQTYQVDPGYFIAFEQDVDLVDLPVQSDRVLSVDKAIKLLKGESDTPRYYTVKQGDTIWDISAALNVSPEDLQAVNPELNPEKIQIDQKIKMVGALDPIINVVATAEKTVQEEVILAQEVRRNPNLPYGQSKVIQQGEKGLKEITYHIVAVNGMETERKVLKETVLKEAKPQVIERSSQTMIASRGLSRPAGAILSPFGMRGGRMHAGIDLSGPYGSPIRASQAGTVIRAGWYGGYGNCVDINHGGGVVTRYAHMSSIAVKNGQTVEKGQAVGKLGSTGRSSGPHLHFEVLINGVPKNPVGYL